MTKMEREYSFHQNNDLDYLITFTTMMVIGSWYRVPQDETLTK